MSSTLLHGVAADVPHMCESVMKPRKLFHRRLLPAPSPSTEGVLLLLVGLGFAEVIPFEFFVKMTSLTLQNSASSNVRGAGRKFSQILTGLWSASFAFSRRGISTSSATSLIRVICFLLLTGCMPGNDLTSFGLRLTALGKAWLRSCSYSEK